MAGTVLLFSDGCTDTDSAEPIKEELANEDYNNTFESPNIPEVKTFNLSKSEQVSFSKQISFSIDLFSAMANRYEECFEGSQGKNLAVSPLSCSILLSMAANYLSDPIKSSIVESLGYTDIKEMNAVNRLLIAYLMTPGTTGMDVNVSNSLWWREELGPLLQPEVCSLLRDSYYTYSQGVDFNQDKTIDLINNWISDNTCQKIQNMLEYMSEDEKRDVTQIIVNTLYMNGEWNTAFDPSMTSKETFHGSYSDSTVDNMHGTVLGGYYGSSEFECVSIPFRGTMGMTIIVPTSVSAEEFSTSFTPDVWNNITSQLKSSEITLSLPKFTISTSAKMNPALADTGIELSPYAKNLLFGNYGHDKTIHNMVKQNTSLTINEVGAEIAAATTMSTATSNISEFEKVTVNIDHPFLYIIKEYTTGAVILAGRVCNL